MPAAYYIVGLGLLNKAPGILQQITIHWALHTMVRSNNISSGEKFAPLNICQNIKEYTKLLVDEILVERNYVPCMILSNQITVVAFQPVQLAQASFLQKNQTLQNVFLISVTLRWHRASVACKNQSF